MKPIAFLVVTICCLAALLTGGPGPAPAAGAPPGLASPAPPDPQSPSDLILSLQKLPPSRPLPDLLKDLENPDARRRWSAARELGGSRYSEALPGLSRRLGDSNLEVRRRTIAALIKQLQQDPAAATTLKKASADLPETDRIMVSAVLEDAAGNAAKAAGFYREAFQREPVRFWAAYHGYDLGPFLDAIREPFLREIDSAIRTLDDHIARPKPVYPESLVRQAYGFKLFADLVGRRVNREATRLIALGKTSDALRLRQFAGVILEPAYDLGRAAKSVEQEIQKVAPEFIFSDSDPVRENQAAFEQIRAQAAADLRRHPGASSEEALIRSLRSDPSPLVRALCAESLGQFCSHSGEAAMIKELEQEERLEVRKSMVLALGCRDKGDARKLIYELARDRDLWEPAVLVIGRWGTAADVEHLLNLAQEASTAASGRSESWESRSREDRLRVLAEALETAGQRAPTQESGRILREAERIRQMTETAIPDKLPGRPVPTRTVIARPESSPGPSPAPAAPPKPTQDQPARTKIASAPPPARPSEEKPVQAKARPLSKEEQEAMDVVAGWLAAWNKQKVETQLGFYHPEFVHNGQDLEAYGRAKRAVAGTSRNLSIKAADFNTKITSLEAVVQYRQEFKSDQHRDCGLKILTLRRHDGRWRIFREEWRAIKDCPS